MTAGALVALLLGVPAPAQESESAKIDLPTALRLAGAQNLDVQIARERLAEARANETSATWRFFPWLSVGIGFRRHDGMTQEVGGNVIDVHKLSYAPGVTVGAELALGDAWYRKLAAGQVVRATELEVESESQRAVLTAAERYIDLAVAQAAVGVAEEGSRIARGYEAEVRQAVGAGIALRADELRVKVEAGRTAVAARQAAERRRAAAARLAETLKLDPAVDLVTQDADVVPLAIIPDHAEMKTLIAEAAKAHPAVRQSHAAIQAAEAERKGVAYGPLVPALSGQAYLGGLGGGRDGGPRSFGGSADIAAMVHWRLGPGGLLDQGRLDAARARQTAAERRAEQVRREATRHVVESHTRWKSTAEQMQTARDALAAAEEGLGLARQRRQFAVANVLENILAEQDLTRARNDYLRAIGEHNKAQYGLQWAIGGLQPPRR